MSAETVKPSVEQDTIDSASKWMADFLADLAAGKISSFGIVALGAGERTGLEKEMYCGMKREIAAIIANMAKHLTCDCGTPFCPYVLGGNAIVSIAGDLAEHGTINAKVVMPTAETPPQSKPEGSMH